MKGLRLHIATFFILISVFCTGQQKMHVVTRVVEETFVFKKEFLLELDAEKANIIITKSTDNKLKIKLSQSVKDKSRTVAEGLLEAQKSTFNKERDRLLVRNFLLFEAGIESTNSIFQSKYEIQVPVHLCHLKIKNNLGDVFISDIQKSIQLDVDYGKVSLENVQSKLIGNLNIGDLIVKSSHIDATLTASNSFISINRCGGTVNGKLDFGSFTCVLQNDLTELFLEADNVDLTLVNPDKVIYNMDIVNNAGEINSVEFSDNLVVVDDKKQLKVVSNLAVGNIRIENEYGNISIY